MFCSGYARKIIFLGAAVLLSACALPKDGASTLGKQSILDAVDVALTRGDCAGAVAAISPLLNSAYVDNKVRLKAASAYGCDAKIDFFTLTQNLISRGVNGLSGKFLWRTLAEYFPSTLGSDYVLEGALLGTETLQAALQPGALVLPIYQVNAGTYNVGSVFASDRISDANIYLTYIAMAGIGGVENRYGATNPATFIKTANLPWTTAVQMTANSDGCAIASSILNLVDGMNATATAAPGDLANVYAPVTALFTNVLDLACDWGCKGGTPPVSADPYTVPPGTPPFNNGGWVTSGCAIAAGCSTCPVALRDRHKCTGLATDVVSCAAAGLVNFVNKSYYGWN